MFFKYLPENWHFESSRILAQKEPTFTNDHEILLQAFEKYIPILGFF